MLSKDFFITGGGFCRKVLIKKNGAMDEYPYSWRDAMKCPLTDGHPHLFIPLSAIDKKTGVVLIRPRRPRRRERVKRRKFKRYIL